MWKPKLMKPFNGYLLIPHITVYKPVRSTASIKRKLWAPVLTNLHFIDAVDRTGLYTVHILYLDHGIISIFRSTGNCFFKKKNWILDSFEYFMENGELLLLLSIRYSRFWIVDNIDLFSENYRAFKGLFQEQKIFYLIYEVEWHTSVEKYFHTLYMPPCGGTVQHRVAVLVLYVEPGPAATHDVYDGGEPVPGRIVEGCLP